MSRETLQQFVAEAGQSCSPLFIAEIKQGTRDYATYRFLNGEVDLKTYKERLRCIPETGRVDVFCQDDLRTLLRIVGWSPFQIPDTMVHEADHYAVAERYNLSPHYGVELVSVEGSTAPIVYTAYVDYDLPLSLGDGLARQILTEMLTAPKRLSCHDKQSLSGVF